MKAHYFAALATCTLISVAPAEAVTFRGTAVGSWVNIQHTVYDVYSVANQDSGGTAVFTMGIPADSKRARTSFTFDGVGSDGDAPWIAVSETPFKVGDFSYINNPATYADGLTGVDLKIVLAISDPFGISSENFLFSFHIENTENLTGNPVLDGDIAQITSSLSSTTFDYAGSDYTLQLLGFSSDSGATIRTDFSSPEGGSASAELFATITSHVTGTPDTGSTPGLLGIGALALGAVRRRLR